MAARVLGVGIYDSEDRQIFSDVGHIPTALVSRARILRQSKFNECRITESKVGDDDRG
jgi:hypothetical protein